jgi:pyrroline-5-carboxylate reductase
MNKKIAIIGGGNLGAAMAEGLVKQRVCICGSFNGYQEKY